MDVTELLNDLNLHHSNIQIDNFIIKKNGITNYGMYMQSLREIMNRKQSLLSLNYELKKHKLKIEELKHKLQNDNVRDDFSKRKWQLELDYLNDKTEYMERSIKSSENEMNRFVDIAIRLKEDIGEIDDDKRMLLETDFWIHKLAYNASSEIRSSGIIAKPTLEALDYVPIDIAEKVQKEIELVAPQGQNNHEQNIVFTTNI